MAYANKVSSHLEGSTNEHLDIVLSATNYAIILNIPYVRTQHPGTLLVVDPANFPGTAIAREELRKNIKLF